MTAFNDPIELFDHLLKNSADDLEAGLAQTLNITDDTRLKTHQLITAHLKNKAHTLFKQTIEQSSDLLNNNKNLSRLKDECISHFTLDTLLGAGGMGVVYLAHRNDGQFKQQVAIKIIYPSITALHGTQNLSREAQYLAQLTHPNIAGVLDAGECEFGMYMVMEYIEGTTLLTYCHEHNLNTKQRLSLFCKVCDAVSYAHQNRVIHADLKPSNILVNKQGEPKLVDFGIARAINSEQTDFVVDEYIKALSQEYASPEQLAGQTLTTQSDVYSLGKVLSILILNKNNDLIQISNKSVANELKNRYASCFELKSDINRLLTNLPISTNTNTLYLFSKLLKRHPLSTALLSLLIITTFIFYGVLWQQNKKLQEEQELANAALDFMLNTFEQGNPEINKGKDVLAKDLLIQLQKQTLLQFDDKPEIQYKLNKKIGDSLTSLGEYQKANIAYEQALKTVKDDSNQYSADFWLSSEIAENLIQLDEFDLADITLKEPLKKMGKSQSRYSLLKGNIAAGNENYQEANNHYITALKHVKDQKLRSSILSAQASNLIDLSEYQQSLKLRKESLEILVQNYPTEIHLIAHARHEVGTLLSDLGEFEESLKYSELSITESTEIYGQSHPIVAERMANVANTYASLKKVDIAIPIFEKAIDILNSFYETPNINIAFIYVYLANAQIDNKSFEAALANYDTALNINDTVSHSDAHISVSALNGKAVVYRDMKQFTKAAITFTELLQIVTDEYGKNHPRRGIILANTMPVHKALGNLKQAKLNAKEAIRIFDEQYGDDNHYTKVVQGRLDKL